MEWILIVAVIFLAFANGANDNFKGFATVWGSGTLEYRQALTLATIATIAGSLLSWMLADGLVQQFSGKGLVASEATQSLPFIASVAIGAAVTVFLATRLGLPVSTTHALIGGLVGAGAAQAGGVHFAKLADTFLLPLFGQPLARGVNDTPKLVALLLMAHGLGHAHGSVVVIALAKALGGVLFARKVAQTMSQRVTKMDHASGLAANLITASLVLFASKLGLPVSTTHVSVGAIAGVGASARTLDWQALRNVLLSWVLTLPLAAAVAWAMSQTF
jgi:PiT family inorganic phosphate transporter